MSVADAILAAKIAGTGGGSVTVDAALDASSTNPVQNKAVKAALDRKAGTAVATASANGLMSKADKAKLDGLSSSGGATTYDVAATASAGGTNQALQGFVCSASSKQLRTAIDAGKTPRLVITIGTAKMYMPMAYYWPIGAEYAYACFGCVGEGGAGAYLYYVVCDGESESESGTPSWVARSVEATPATSS